MGVRRDIVKCKMGVIQPSHMHMYVLLADPKVKLLRQNNGFTQRPLVSWELCQIFWKKSITIVCSTSLCHTYLDSTGMPGWKTGGTQAMELVVRTTLTRNWFVSCPNFSQYTMKPVLFAYFSRRMFTKARSKVRFLHIFCTKLQNKSAGNSSLNSLTTRTSPVYRQEIILWSSVFFCIIEW